MIRSFKELGEELRKQEEIYSKCNHTFEKTDKYCSEGRLGGLAIGIVRCPKCGLEQEEEEV